MSHFVLSSFTNSSLVSQLADVASLFSKLVFIYKLEPAFSALNGQYILAQGRVSGGTIRNAALGKKCRRKNRPRGFDEQSQ